MPEMSRMVEIWIFAGLGVMVVLFLMSGIARLYRKAGPHERSSCTAWAGRAWCRGTARWCFPWCRSARICRWS